MPYPRPLGPHEEVGVRGKDTKQVQCIVTRVVANDALGGWKSGGHNMHRIILLSKDDQS